MPTTPQIGIAHDAGELFHRHHAPQLNQHASEVTQNHFDGTGHRQALPSPTRSAGAGTRVDAAGVLTDRGAKSVYAAVSHRLLAGDANQRLDGSPIARLFTTDSVETQPTAPSSEVEVVSVAPLIGEAIRRIARRESISVHFR